MLRDRRGLLGIGSALVLSLWGCDHHRASAPAVAVPQPHVAATVPADGAVGVAPDASVLLTLDVVGAGLAAADVVVTDGGNRLPGALHTDDGGATWTWTPAFELPRGCRIEIGTVQQGVLAAFTVRDLVTKSFELPGEQVTLCLAWHGGRRAVRTASGRVFEVVAGVFVERFVDMPVAARAYGDGDFVGERDDQGVHYCVRGNLDGSIDRVPTPAGASIGDHNRRGDVVAFVPATLGAPVEQGLWRLPRSANAFEFAGALSLGAGDHVDDVPSIADDGTVSLAHANATAVGVSLFAPGDLAGVHHELPVGGTSAQFAVAADGRGVLAFLGNLSVTTIVVRAARFVPGEGLVLLPEALRSWTPLPVTPPEFHPFWRVDDVRVGELGSACIVLASGAWVTGSSTTTNYETVRIEPDDRVGGVVPMTTSLDPASVVDRPVVSPLRAEAWGVRTDAVPAGTIVLVRSRPDAIAAGFFAKDAPAALGAPSFAFDDSNRAIFAVVERRDVWWLWSSRVLLAD